MIDHYAGEPVGGRAPPTPACPLGPDLAGNPTSHLARLWAQTPMRGDTHDQSLRATAGWRLAAATAAPPGRSVRVAAPAAAAGPVRLLRDAPPQGLPPQAPPRTLRRRRTRRRTLRNALYGISAGIFAIVILSIALSGGSQPPPAPASAAGPAASASATAAPAEAAPPPAPAPVPRVLATFTGSGIQNTTQFTIGGDGNWNLDWTYNCAAFGTSGNFIVGEDQDGLDPSGVNVNELGNGGTGTAHAYGDAGLHFLDVNSECSWTMKVIGVS
jgi:hypothetical protein